MKALLLTLCLFFGFSTVTFAEGDMEAPDSGEVSDVAQKPPESKKPVVPKKAQHAKNMKAKKATGKAKQKAAKVKPKAKKKAKSKKENLDS